MKRVIYPADDGELLYDNVPIEIHGVQDNPPEFPGWSRSRYEEAVRIVLEKIYATASGTILIDTLANLPQRIQIQPQFGLEVAAKALDHLAAFPLGQRERLCADSAYRKPGTKRLLAKYTGTGRGSAIVIFFTPLNYMGKTAPGEAQDEVLLHELVHAYRIARARVTCKPWRYNMDTVEEVIAIAITNLYASERKRPLRNDHHGFVPITNPKQWMENMRPPLEEFCRQEQSLVHQLGAVSPFGFNPLRECKAPLGWVQL